MPKRTQRQKKSHVLEKIGFFEEQSSNNLGQTKKAAVQPSPPSIKNRSLTKKLQFLRNYLDQGIKRATDDEATRVVLRNWVEEIVTLFQQTPYTTYKDQLAVMRHKLIQLKTQAKRLKINSDTILLIQNISLIVLKTTKCDLLPSTFAGLLPVQFATLCLNDDRIIQLLETESYRCKQLRYFNTSDLFKRQWNIIQQSRGVPADSRTENAKPFTP